MNSAFGRGFSSFRRSGVKSASGFLGRRSFQLSASSPRPTPGWNYSKTAAGASIATAALAGLALWKSQDDHKGHAHSHLGTGEEVWANSQLPPVEAAVLTRAPNVPPPITRKHQAKVIAHMNATIKEGPLDDTTNYRFWTFNDGVPGPFIRARVGDVLEMAFTNNDEDGLLHNIDFHGVDGPGGGGPALTAERDQTSVLAAKLVTPGIFIYHCAVHPVEAHIANGMYGLLYVEPEEGLPPADKEFYVVQSEFYAAPPSKPGEAAELDFDAGLRENPSHVVFNGRVGSMTGDEKNMLQVNAGDRVRIFFGNAGPNLVSSFHVIGQIFDKVYREGDVISAPARGIQTTLVPAGGATIVEFTADVPGVNTLVDHSIFRTEKGAVGFLKVNGPPRPDLYMPETDNPSCLACRLHP
eukprot:TRINITY_DN7668_c0_g1_i1.p1 TRINITY_DN7668_c0_g1~~TRINITY_DN7668_c0_g1_i1.p1  ORF type:complete len:411 (-),score=93.80 TRINITY_DN7668_c0_g1_i1:216-1448(-)